MPASLITPSGAIPKGGRESNARPLIFPPKKIHQMRLEIFEAVPLGYIVFGVTNGSCMPMVRPGEVLVVEDTPRMCPQEGQWYLMQWISPPYHEWERHKVGQTIGIPHEIKDGKWGYCPPCNFHCGMHYFGDGIFSWEKMTDYIRGRVVGIYRPKSL